MSLQFISHSKKQFSGEITVAGDKSISHRAVMLAAIAEGTSTIEHFLNGYDCLATLKAFQQMGVKVNFTSATTLVIQGVGKHGLKPPEETINCGNSGTSIRLISGLLAGQKFNSELTGDASLQKRPMRRILQPLRRMGANISAKEDNYPPLQIHKVANLQAIDYRLPVASAQVKSALLLAGLYANGETVIHEPKPTRDHTELMLESFAVDLHKQGDKIALIGENQTLKATEIYVPGDISSAAFFIVATLITSGSELVIKNVGINPTRTGIIKILRLMGAHIDISNQRHFNRELVADLLIKSSELHGVEIPRELIPAAIDEFPIIFVAAANAQGTTRLQGADELRVKESDRIAAMAQGLRTNGIQLEETSDGITIQGGELTGGEVNSYHDHRIAMAFSIAGLIAKTPIVINDCDNVATSFPNFITLAKQLSLPIEEKKL
ncbi:MAG: 3-phosphoshikimate 1-carboxyvinyltransferase [Pseudomonadota bacterium]